MPADRRVLSAGWLAHEKGALRTADVVRGYEQLQVAAASTEQTRPFVGTRLQCRATRQRQPNGTALSAVATKTHHGKRFAAGEL